MEIENREAKERVAEKIIDKVKDGQVIGFGSGTTSYIAVEKIGEKVKREGLNITAIPTSNEIRELCERSEERRVGKECRSRWSPYH